MYDKETRVKIINIDQRDIKATYRFIAAFLLSAEIYTAPASAKR